MHIIEVLTERDITKIDRVLDRPALEIFTHLSYLRDYTQEQNRIIRQNNVFANNI